VVSCLFGHDGDKIKPASAGGGCRELRRRTSLEDERKIQLSTVLGFSSTYQPIVRAADFIKPRGDPLPMVPFPSPQAKIEPALDTCATRQSCFSDRLASKVLGTALAFGPIPHRSCPKEPIRGRTLQLSQRSTRAQQAGDAWAHERSGRRAKRRCCARVALTLIYGCLPRGRPCQLLYDIMAVTTSSALSPSSVNSAFKP
jgi:hypothetical protein